MENGQIFSQTLDQLEIGSSAWVLNIRADGLLRRRLLDLGFVPGTEITSTLISPMGDPRGYRIHDTVIALRQQEASLIVITRIAPSHQEPSLSQPSNHISQAQNVSSSSPFHYVVALAGNPNSGKSTVFNALTGLHQHVGNWPGKTVARCEGSMVFANRPFQIVDLPGTYSLLSSSPEEEIARDFLLFGAPDCTIIVLDSTSLTRHLNLAFQVMEITDRVIVCLNFADEAARKGISIDTEKLAEKLGVPVVFCSARKGQGLDVLKERMEAVASGKIHPRPVRIPLAKNLGAAVADLVPLIEKIFPTLPNARWIALRLIDGGDARLRQEIQEGVLADLAGQIGLNSVAGLCPDLAEQKR
jgi:ferrous iron transport protein B